MQNHRLKQQQQQQQQALMQQALLQQQSLYHPGLLAPPQVGPIHFSLSLSLSLSVFDCCFDLLPFSSPCAVSIFDFRLLPVRDCLLELLGFVTGIDFFSPILGVWLIFFISVGNWGLGKSLFHFYLRFFFYCFILFVFDFCWIYFCFGVWSCGKIQLLKLYCTIVRLGVC